MIKVKRAFEARFNIDQNAQYVHKGIAFPAVLSFDGIDLLAAETGLSLDVIPSLIAWNMSGGQSVGLASLGVEDVRDAVHMQVRAWQAGTSGLHVVRLKNTNVLAMWED